MAPGVPGAPLRLGHWFGALALTGTPGTGKSAVARLLAGRLACVEVGDLALATGTGRRARGAVRVDLPRLARRVRSGPALRGVDLVVGHLAHRLPLRDAVVLRCHPRELRARLERAGRGTPSDRAENVTAEALDLVLVEALARARRVYEIDTTGRPAAAVARAVLRRVRGRGPSAYGRVDWLADPWVQKHLLGGAS